MDIIYFINGYGSKPYQHKSLIEIEECFGEYFYLESEKIKLSILIRILVDAGRLVEINATYKIVSPGSAKFESKLKLGKELRST